MAGLNTNERYVVVGLAKTGTTIVATTILRTLKISAFCMEPDEAADLAPFAQHPRLVIKVLFDLFRSKPGELLSICDAPVIVAIDPRDEVVSRLHYLAYAYFLTRPTTEDDRNAWLDIFRDKETCANYGVLDIERRLMN